MVLVKVSIRCWVSVLCVGIYQTQQDTLPHRVLEQNLQFVSAYPYFSWCVHHLLNMAEMTFFLTADSQTVLFPAKVVF